MSEENSGMTASAEVLYDARPTVLPHRTYTPAVVALGLVLLFWGLITSNIILVAGLGLLGVGVAGWIEELLRGRRDNPEP